MDKISFYKDMIKIVENTSPNKLPNRLIYLTWMTQQLSYLYRLQEMHQGNPKNKITITGPVVLDLNS